MAKLTNIQIKRMAEDLRTGMICYVHKKTGDYKAFFDLDDDFITEEFDDEERAEVEQHAEQYHVVEKMSSREAFGVMESFLQLVESRNKRGEIINALNRRSPFANFKAEVEHDPKYGQRWFNHRDAQYISYVRNELGGYFDLELWEYPSESESEAINLDGKIFKLVVNSDAGAVDSKTIFEYEQDDDLLIADYSGGAIRTGKITGVVKSNQVNLVYHCLTTDGDLKAGIARGEVLRTDDGKIEMKLNWQWLQASGEVGQSIYREE